jgi:hypothetical protein
MKWSEILAATPFPFDNQNWSRRKLSYFLKNAGTLKTGGGLFGSYFASASFGINFIQMFSS